MCSQSVRKSSQPALAVSHGLTRARFVFLRRDGHGAEWQAQVADESRSRGECHLWSPIPVARLGRRSIHRCHPLPPLVQAFLGRDARSFVDWLWGVLRDHAPAPTASPELKSSRGAKQPERPPATEAGADRNKSNGSRAGRDERGTSRGSGCESSREGRDSRDHASGRELPREERDERDLPAGRRSAVDGGRRSVSDVRAESVAAAAAARPQTSPREQRDLREQLSKREQREARPPVATEVAEDDRISLKRWQLLPGLMFPQAHVRCDMCRESSHFPLPATCTALVRIVALLRSCAVLSLAGSSKKKGVRGRKSGRGTD